MDDTPASANATVCEGPSWNPSKVAVRVVTAPVYGESYNSVSCSRSDTHAQDELMSGGDMFKVLIVTMKKIRYHEKTPDTSIAVNPISTILRDPVQISLALSVSWFGRETGL